MSIELFYCYAHEDKKLCEKLDRHLSGLKRSGTIKSWHDGEVNPGTEWKKEVSDHLKSSDLVLLLVSSDFFHSDYCYRTEMEQALSRHSAGEAVVIPILLRPVDWEGSPFSALQMLPSEAKPVTLWVNEDDAFTDIARGIRRAVEKTAERLTRHSFKQSPPNPTDLICRSCGGLLSQANSKFCEHCGQSISQEMTQIDSISLTAPASPLLLTQAPFAGQEKEQAYKSLCQQYESESVTAIIVRVGDNQIGKNVYVVPEDQWYDKHELSYYFDGKKSPVKWLSVGSQTIPVAIFKSSSNSPDSLGFNALLPSTISPGGYMIWIDNKPPRRIFVVNKKVIFVDLSIGVPEHSYSIPAKKPDDGVGVKNLSQTSYSSLAPNVSDITEGQVQASISVSPNASSTASSSNDNEVTESSTEEGMVAILGGCFVIGAVLFQVLIVPVILGFLLHSGWAFTGFFLGQIVLTGVLFFVIKYLCDETTWDNEYLGGFLISLPSSATSGVFAWLLASYFFHMDWLSLIAGAVLFVFTMLIIGFLAMTQLF